MKECLWITVFDYNYNMVEGLLMYGISPDIDSCNGKKFYVPILEASKLRDREMVELLLKYGATVAADSFTVKNVLAKQA